ncbi:hypothetical protein [Salinilacihabitans rarus]|uniref:hypothetical protein n=1 Tax=Salinilacihabitans rarus TaxID=2961596 RepID=UPI0020C85641|nr:hypothetical protein [Salinilacihabitans rarus]
MIELAVGMSMAGPMFVVGVEFARTGQPAVGISFFALGAFALFFPSYVVRRIGGPRTWIRRRLGGADDAESEADRSGLFDRLLNR